MTINDGSSAPPDVFLVIVTHNRADYLANLLLSVSRMDPLPQGLVVVDNASGDDTQEVIGAFAATMPEGFVVEHRLDSNLGGSGGFSAGLSIALEHGAQWMWMMDDDVRVLPHALSDLGRWTQFKCLHGRRYDHDGTAFFWQTRFSEFLGIFYPQPGDVFARRDYFLTNVGCFEGMLIHRDVVRQIGLPDPRFFITWDDAVYGWLSSRVTPVAYVNVFVLQRMRPQSRISLGIRHLNDSSDMSRYYVMRNRAYVANYLAEHGSLHRVGFAIGTMLTFGKEVLRVLAVERRPGGMRPILRGFRESVTLRRQREWEPMRPLGPR